MGQTSLTLIESEYLFYNFCLCPHSVIASHLNTGILKSILRKQIPQSTLATYEQAMNAGSYSEDMLLEWIAKEHFFGLSIENQN